MILKLLSGVYSSVSTIITSIFKRLFGSTQDSLDNLNDERNQYAVVPRGDEPPIPPPMPELQILAGLPFPFLNRNRPSLRDLMQPLAEAIAEHQNIPQQPQLRLGKRWRMEDQADNVQAIEKALEQFEKEENLLKEDTWDFDGEPEPIDSRDEIISNE